LPKVGVEKLHDSTTQNILRILLTHFSAIKYKKAIYKVVQITGNIELSGNHDFLISKSTHPQDIQ